MKYSLDGLHLTEQFEGCKLQAYTDQVGVWTIGYGHTHGVSPSMTCTQAQAEAWLAEDVQSAENSVNRLVSVPLEQNEFDALVDFVFNLGARAFEQSTMLVMLNLGDREGSAKQFERWDMAGGKHIAGLLRRRLAERDLFEGK